MARQFNDSDEGKRVVNTDGNAIGTVDRVSGTTAHITPESGLSQQLRERLGWESDDRDTYMLSHDRVEEITEEEIRLTADL